MGRRPKYKIWDKQENCWYKPIYEAYNNRLEDLSLTTHGELQRRTMNGVDHESMFPDRYEVLEYIGSKDRNGKEICEGDIMLHPFHNELIFVVEWCDLGWHLVCED